MPNPNLTTPLEVAIVGVLVAAIAFAVGFGVIDNTVAGLAISLGTSLVVLGAQIYAAVHAHATATIVASRAVPPRL